MSPPPKYNRPEAPQWLSQSIRLECSSQPLLTHPGVCTGLVPKDTASATPFQAPGSICSQGKHGAAMTNPFLLLRKRIWDVCSTWVHAPDSTVKRRRTTKYPELAGIHRDHPVQTPALLRHTPAIPLCTSLRAWSKCSWSSGSLDVLLWSSCGGSNNKRMALL